MAIYKKVQFITWEIYTGPGHINIGTTNLSADSYPGINCTKKDERTDVHSQCIDIDARVAFTKDAIEKAYDKISKETNDEENEVLKIFMAPEFLYRGSGGAYMFDLIYGWPTKKVPQEFSSILPPGKYDNWAGLFGELKSIVNDDKYKNWLFIFGTAVCAYFDMDGKTPLINNIEPIPISNISLIQLGGSENKNSDHIAEKKYISGIDFIDYKLSSDIYKSNFVTTLDDWELIPQSVMGYMDSQICTFSIPGINNEQGKIDFGIEICLDHYCCGEPEKQPDGTLKNSIPGRLKKLNNPVDIQLVPSCGMTLNPVSICLKQQVDPKLKSYAFNCDGLTQLPLASKYGAHVQIWNGSTPIKKVVEKGNNFQNIDGSLLKVIEKVDIKVFYTDKPEETRTINATELWNFDSSKKSKYVPQGSGFIRVIDLQPL